MVAPARKRPQWCTRAQLASCTFSVRVFCEYAGGDMRWLSSSVQGIGGPAGKASSGGVGSVSSSSGNERHE
ncbi:hypothetical protein IWW43_006553 [Coemansia sp. RSA 1935]|nr:hypothetical protein IWW43_006553 [Coemansia sp. RSA 1935]